MAGRRNPRVLRKPGGEQVSRRLLTARVIGCASGVSVNLGDMRAPISELLRRCAYLNGDGKLLLNAEQSKMVKTLELDIDQIQRVITNMGDTAGILDEAIRKSNAV